jgi:cytochrome P450
MLCMASDGHANQHADGDPQRPQPHEFAAHAHLQRKEPQMSATTVETAMESAKNADEAPIPTGIQLTPFDEAFLNDPYPVLKRLRDAEPIHRDNALSRWFVTGFDNVREVLRNKDLSNDINRALPESYTGRIASNAKESGMSTTINSILFMDDPDHRRLRSLVSKPFSAKAVEELRPRIRANVAELLDTITEARFDAVESFAAPLPVIIISEMLGIDHAERTTFKKWSEDITAGLFNPLKLAEQSARGALAQQALTEYLGRVIETRRQQPGTDLISTMISANEDRERMTDSEIVSQCSLILVAGNVTTSDLIANGIKALLQHPDQFAALRAQPELIVNAVEEVLRYDSSVIQANRVVPVDTSVTGCPMHKNESITVSLASANRDPNANPEPDRFDIRRKDIRHQSFGGNKHLCLGAHLARVETQEAILALIQRFPNLSLVEQEFNYRPVPSFRALMQLWVRCA